MLVCFCVCVSFMCRVCICGFVCGGGEVAGADIYVQCSWFNTSFRIVLYNFFIIIIIFTGFILLIL